MKLQHVLIFGVGAAFLGVGLIQRKKSSSTNWKAFVIGGVALIVLDVLLIGKAISF
ncbi:MAG TPA: hypothetical protein VL171_04775 [Verrucomicrobiae bacterium]|nr:hypothetical protein [Verrucomicrobiae bacterium]